MGKAECNKLPRMMRRLSGHFSIGPREVSDQSFSAISRPISLCFKKVNCLGSAIISMDEMAGTYEIRKIFPKFIEDMPKYKFLEKVKSYFEKSDASVFSNDALPVNSINGRKRSHKINL